MLHFQNSINAQQTLQAVVKHNVFFTQENHEWNPYVEVYFDVDPHSILFEKRIDSFYAKIRVDIELKNEQVKINRDNYYLETTPVAKAIETYSLRVTDLRRLLIKSGKTEIVVKLTDNFNKEHPFVYTANIDVVIPKEQFFFSDIQVVDTNIISSQESIYQRNNHLQFPLASDFLEERKFLNYYAEYYHPDTSFANQVLLVKTYVSKKEFGESILKPSKMDTLTHQPISINEGKFDVSTLPSGNYYINMEIQDKPFHAIASKSLFFQVYNKKPVPMVASKDTVVEEQEKIQVINLAKAFVAKYKPEQIRAILKMLLPIALPTEKNSIADFLKNNDDVYSRYFIYNFWMSRDKNEPEKAWKEYAEKVKVVNRLFGTNSLRGYESDRGIIQLKYGEPNDRIEVSSEEGALPYEVWQYNSLPKNGNALFLFYKPGNGLGNYELLHSTVVGERRNQQWRSYLYMNGVNNNNIGSKAEFYIGTR